MKFNIKKLQNFVFIFCLCGFPLMASLVMILGSYSSSYSIFFRAINLLIAFVLIFRLFFADFIKHKNFWLLVMLYFWVFYIIRLFYDTVGSAESLSRPQFDYWIFALGVTIVPSLALFNVNINFFNGLDCKVFFYLFLSGVLLVFIEYFFVDRESSLIQSGRLSLDVINANTVGYIGGSLLLMGVFLLSNGYFYNSVNGFLKYIFFLSCIGGLIVGAYLLVVSGSRGAVLGTIISLVAYFVVSKTINYRAFLLVIFLMVCGYILIVEYLSLIGYDNIIQRYGAVFMGGDESISGRQERYYEAIDQFLSNPLLGDFIEVRSIKDYPHNLVLESFMSLGIFGGLIFVLIYLKGLISSFNILWNKNDAWIGLLYIQYAIGAMFSGSLWGSATFWTLTVVVIVRAKLSYK